MVVMVVVGLHYIKLVLVLILGGELDLLLVC